MGFIGVNDKSNKKPRNLIFLIKKKPAEPFSNFSTCGVHSKRIHRLLLLAIFQLILVNEAQAQSQLDKNYSEFLEENQRPNLILFNVSTKMTSAREYLGKFGWVHPADWTDLSPRLNESATIGGPSISINEMKQYELQVNENINKNVTETGSLVVERFKALSKEKFEEALRNFQYANGLAVTGELDEETLAMMTQLRCGVPDQTRKVNATDGNLTDFNASLSNYRRPNASATVSPSDMANESEEKMNTTSLVTASSTLASFNTSLERKRRQLREADIVDNAQLSNETNYESIENISANLHSINEKISEAELSLQSRVESLEEILQALRDEKMEYKGFSTDSTTRFNAISSSEDLLSKIVLSSRKIHKKKRKKRSGIYEIYQPGDDWGLAFTKRTITWRLIKEWPSSSRIMSSNEVWFTVKLAFRMWSEVLPRIFLEDNVSPISDVDILIGFGSRRHNRCPVTFYHGPFMREYAHAWPLPKAEIHFNNDQPFVPVSWVPNVHNPFRLNSIAYPISLLKVAIHEIGHTLGLPHSEVRTSVMNAIYQPYLSKDVVELADADRKTIQNIYGKCELQFDAVFDWLRKIRLPSGGTQWKYNTYFFRKGWFWLYVNRSYRPRYGDPKLTSDTWRDVMEYPININERLDGVVHIRERNSLEGPTYFFKGDSYFELDNNNQRAKRFDEYGRPFPRRIEENFPGIPYPIDTVFYKVEEENLYFFKDDTVYTYSWSNGKIVDTKLISVAFPGWGGAYALPNNIDSAYFSYTHQAYYFFKDIYFWKLADSRERNLNPTIHIPYNAVGGRRRISSQWKDICDVGESELLMDLPTS